MSQAASQAAELYREVVRTGSVWTLRDASGHPAPENADGKRSMPFWSSRSRVERIIASVPAYAGFEVDEIGLPAFLESWLPELERDDLLVGVNWSGPRAVGYDMTPGELRRNLEAASEASS